MPPAAAFHHRVDEGVVEKTSPRQTFALPVGGQSLQYAGTLGRPGSGYRTVTRLLIGGVTTFDWTYQGSGARIERSEALIRLSPNGLTYLCVCVDGTTRLRHRGAELLLKPGRAALCSTVNPLEARHSTQNRLLTVYVDSVRLESQIPGVGRLIGTTLAVEGVGELLVQHMLATMKVAAGLDSAGLAAASEAVSDLLVGTLSRRAQPVSPALEAQISAYIDSWLGDPELSVERIAAAHHISVRTLHRVFQQRGETVSTHIKNRRLDGCHADLLARPDLMIGAICAKWGITDIAHFSRQYKARFGCTPTDTREQRLNLGTLPTR
ncbi:MAG TPA: helix-turn-helix domain-containing protein [Kutzneria sp.]|jgi:AraC-like DNA-binding protein